MRVIVDFDLCDSNGLCAEVAGDVFELRDDDYLYVVDPTPDLSRQAAVEAAARACPKLAITVLDTGD